MEINKFRGKYFFLSNFYGHLVEYDGLTYKNNEAAFQSAKVPKGKQVRSRGGQLVTRDLFTDLEPNEAKRLGRQVALRDDWENVKLKVMATIVTNKFKDPALRKKLLDTGDADLVEGNTWHDQEWGAYKGVGNNYLGKILMVVREHIKEGKQ